jgi:hypothetical protein
VVPEPEEIRVQRIGEVPGAATGIERVGGPIEKRPLREDEVFPRVFIAGRACACEREVFEVKRGKVAFDLVRRRGPSSKRASGARVEGGGETRLWRAPPLAFRPTIEALDELLVNRQCEPSRPHAQGRHVDLSRSV